MVDTYIYTTELGSKGVTMRIEDSEAIAAVLAVLRNRINEALDVSDYTLVAKLAREADELSHATAIAFNPETIYKGEGEEEVNVDLRTGEIVSDKSEAEHD